MKRIKVLQLQTEFKVKSVDVSDLPEQIVKAFPVERYEFVSGYLIKRPDDKLNESIAERTINLGFEKKSLKGLRLSLLWSLYKFLKQENFDVIICHRFKPVSLLLKISNWVGRPLCISVVHSFSDYRPGSRRRLIKKSISDKWHFVAVSDALKSYLIDLKSGFNENNTHAITNAIDVQKINSLQLDKVAARQFLNLPPAAVIIGSIGRLVPIKGQIYLVRAFAKIARDFPDAHLVIIGSGREFSNLHNEASLLGVSPRVHLLGHKDVAVKYLKAFDIWAMPSLSEGLGLALLEGMSAGLPCVASDIPAMRPLIDASGGIACKPGDVNEFAEALRNYLVLTPDERQEKGRKAHDYICENHDIETFRRSYRKIVENYL